MQVETMSAYARLLRIIAHPTRLMILAELMEAEKCVNDIGDLLNVRQPNASQHLAILKENGLVAFRKEGASRCYYLARPGLVEGLFAMLERHHAGRVDADAGGAHSRQRNASPSSGGSAR